MTQDVLDRFLKEVSYKFPKGYPDMKDPNDVKLLNKLVMEYTNINEEDAVKGPSEYDQIVAATIGDGKTYPMPHGTYDLGKDGTVESSDLANYKALYHKTPKTAAGGESSKGTGHGELAMYWLLQSTHKGDVTDNRTASRDAADLNVGGKTLEVKALGGKKTIPFGRIGNETKALAILNIVFGATSLSTAIENEEFVNDGNSLGFKPEQLKAAVRAFDALRTNKGLQDLETGQNGMPKVDFIAQIMARFNAAYKAIGEYKTSEEGAGKLALNLLSRKILSKLGGSGYIVDVTPNGNMKYYYLDSQDILKADPKKAVDNIVVNQGILHINPTGLQQAGGSK